jgi:hypothetical protein
VISSAAMSSSSGGSQRNSSTMSIGGSALTQAQAQAHFRHRGQQHNVPQQQQRRWMGHSVKIVLKEDMPNGKGYAGDIVTVKAGYARNYLVPQKIAFYATADNISKYGSDKSEEDVQKDAAKSAEREASAEKTAAIILRKYLKEKEVRECLRL